MFGPYLSVQFLCGRFAHTIDPDRWDFPHVTVVVAESIQYSRGEGKAIRCYDQFGLEDCVVNVIRTARFFLCRVLKCNGNLSVPISVRRHPESDGRIPLGLRDPPPIPVTDVLRKRHLI